MKLKRSVPLFEYIKSPIHRYTFRSKRIREWVEKECEGKTLNLFAGMTILAIDEIRNDVNSNAVAKYHLEALTFIAQWQGNAFDTILLDPPYSYRKSMELYNGRKASRFRQLKDLLPAILKPGGKIITFGYHSTVMGIQRGFTVEKIVLFSHGGAIHDTIASIERHNGKSIRK